MDNKIGFKELYDVTLKATYNIEMGDRTINAGEVIAIFDKIQLAQFNEIKSFASVNGGLHNGARVFWNDTKELKLSFSQGVFSSSQLSLLTNGKLLKTINSQRPMIHRRETLVFPVGIFKIELKNSPVQNIFVYRKDSGDLVSSDNYQINGKQFCLTNEGIDSDLIIDYEYQYESTYQTLLIGSNLTNGYLSFTAKTRIKDDVTGQVTTGIINIPKLKLMSDLSMVLGNNATPQVGKFDAVAVPVRYKGNQVVMEFIMLDEDIDSDIL